MSNSKTANKDQNLCVLSIALTLITFAGVRLVELFVTPSRTVALVLAMVCTIALAVVFFIVSKTKNAFFGLLASLIGYKMMPPTITTLAATSIDGAVLYYVVKKVAVVLFVVMAIKLYKMQKDQEKKIFLIPVLAIMAVVPFLMEIGKTVGMYLTSQLGGSMIYCYFTQYIFYVIATVVILGVALKYNYDTLRFVCYYEFIALSINALKKIALTAAFMVKGQHVSKDNIAWILIFAVLIVCFAVIKNKAKKAELSK